MPLSSLGIYLKHDFSVGSSMDKSLENEGNISPFKIKDLHEKRYFGEYKM